MPTAKTVICRTYETHAVVWCSRNLKKSLTLIRPHVHLKVIDGACWWLLIDSSVQCHLKQQKKFIARYSGTVKTPAVETVLN